MNRILVFLAVIILFGCNSKPKQNFPISTKEDVNAIIATVTAQDSLFYGKSRRPLSIDLQKIKLYNDSELPPPPPPTLYFSTVGINELINEKYHKMTSIDSAYLFFQNDTIRNFRISPNLLSGFKLTTMDSILKKEKLNGFDPFIAITIPVFSLDQKKAYLEINDHCGGCGGGIGVFLEKINGHWIIKESYSTWVN